MESIKQDENKTMNWFERLQFYTKDFNKEETIKLARHITWVKVEGLLKEGKEIEDLIENHFDKRGQHVKDCQCPQCKSFILIKKNLK